MDVVNKFIESIEDAPAPLTQEQRDALITLSSRIGEPTRFDAVLRSESVDEAVDELIEVVKDILDAMDAAVARRSR